MTNSKCRIWGSFLVLLAATTCADDGLVAHWKLHSDAVDSIGGRNAVNHGVRFADGSAMFDGRQAWLEVPTSPSLKFGTGDFSISVWVHTEQALDDVLGDLLTCYDPTRRTGFTLSLMNYAGVTAGQSNWRNVLFGMDAAHIAPQWTDCGRPGENHYVKALAVYDGDLYASTWEPDAGQRGHVYRYAGGKRWIDCGSPDKCNAINAMAVYQGKLYVGSERYSGGGSSLPLSPNENDGGCVYRYDGGTKWTNVGKIADVRSIGGLATFRGKLYAGTGTTGAWRDTPRTRGMYRYDGDGKWTSCGCPGLRVVHLHVHDGNLYGLSYDGGGFFRYEGGTAWTRLGPSPRHHTGIFGSDLRRRHSRWHVADGQRFPLRRTSALDKHGTARRGKRSHGHGRLQRQVVCGNVAIRRGLSLRRRKSVDLDGTARPHTRRPLPPCLVHGRLPGKVVLRCAAVGQSIVVGGRQECHL